jgi:hypothetical protein
MWATLSKRRTALVRGGPVPKNKTAPARTEASDREHSQVNVRQNADRAAENKKTR